MIMEVENKNMSSTITITKEEEEEDVELPGFRFHPTDEELVGFYLRRKVEKRPIRFDLIKLVDIYKFDPWDLPKSNGGVGEKEWYFFCRRGRKYKNSMRPNRVTRSGFWKATGIDRPIYSSARECIGLKKSLVYYRGSAGKGTKTEWMMHEFRLPTANDKSTKHVDSKPIPQEAEVWTLCRILKRSASYRKCVPDWREMAAAKRSSAASDTCSVESNGQSGSSYISFTAAAPVNVMKQQSEKAVANHQQQHQMIGHLSPATSVVSEAAASSYDIYGDVNEFLRHADWEDLRSVVDCAAAAHPLLYTDPQYY